ALRNAITQAFDKWQKTGLTINALKLAQLRAKKEEQKSSEQLQYWGLFRAQKIAIAPEEVWRRIETEREKLTASDVKKTFTTTVAAPMMLFIETPLKMEAALNDSKIALKDTMLANGVRIVARQSPGNSIVGGHLLFANRSLREPQAMHGIAELAHTLLESGSANYSTDKWQDTLAALGLEWKTADDPNIPYDNYYTTSEFSFIRFDVPVANLNPSLSLIVSAIQAPRWDESRFEQAKKAALGRAGRESGTARALAQIELEKKLYSGEVQPSPYGTPASLQGIDISTVKAFSSTYWSGANLIVTLDGPDTPEQMISAVMPALSLLSKGESVLKSERKIVTSSGEVTVKAGKSQSYLIVVSHKPVSDNLSDEAVAVAGTLLSNRVQQVLRETKGWAYNVGASAALASDGVMISMTIGTKKELLDSAAIEMKNVYRNFLIATLPDSEITRTQHSIAGRNRMREAGRQYRAFR
ncbi:MAG: insulinase family protein, partial [bacterium]|nr:insulinase family protein [bacterium]